MTTLAEITAGAKAAGWSIPSRSSSSSTLSRFNINLGNSSNINPVAKTGFGLRPFQESGFVGFTGVGTDTMKQFSIGDMVAEDYKSGTKFIDEREAKAIGAISDTGKSNISGKGVFTAFSDLFRQTTNQNLMTLGDKLTEAKDERDRIEGSTAGAFAGLTQFVQDVQSQLGAVDKRLSEQVTQIGQDTTQLGKKANGDGGAFWDNLASALGVGVPVLAIGGIAALLLLRR